MTDCSRKAVTVCPSVSTIITINNFRSCATCQRTISSSKLIVDWNNQSASMITILNTVSVKIMNCTRTVSFCMLRSAARTYRQLRSLCR